LTQNFASTRTVVQDMYKHIPRYYVIYLGILHYLGTPWGGTAARTDYLGTCTTSESFPCAMVRYLPPRAGVVRGTLLLATYVMYAVVDGSSVFRTAKPLGVPSRSLERDIAAGVRYSTKVRHHSRPSLSYSPYAVRRGRPYVELSS